jgi:broad specificity phosphatase PhoE
MQQVVRRQARPLEFLNDQLTEQGKERCLEVKPTLGSFVITIGSLFGRTQETAQLLSDVEPRTDERASIPETHQNLARGLRSCAKHIHMA